MYDQGFTFSDVSYKNGYTNHCGQGLISGEAERNDMSFTFSVSGKIKGSCKDFMEYSNEAELLHDQPYFETAYILTSFDDGLK